MVGKNSHLDVHGDTATDTLLIIDTTSGLQGFGWANASETEAVELLNKDPLNFFHPAQGVVSPLGRGDAPLWDLAGKILGEPAWRLLGGYGPEWVPVYDGSIYFSDLQPEYAERGISRILEEVDHSLERGHRAFKIKVGRGFKWMEPEVGLARDIEVVRAIRAHVDPDVKLMVDSNNGYDLDTTKRFLEEADVEFFFVEEMFPESVEEDLELKRWIQARGWETLVADGESARDIEHFTPYIARAAFDVLQGDIRRFGFTELRDLARLAAPAGIGLAPHNWGSYLGLYMQAVLGRGIPNFVMAEQDPAQTELFDASGFELREGRMRVPDTPGCGLALRTERLANQTLDWELNV
ncbi:MAG TPA: hypothetical protein EYN90_05250 [Acidobacteria bacterium]|nr:hypothetical protein [Acidobacteriota bacterium]